MKRARELLSEAARLYDDPDLPLERASRTTRDFASGAEWMRLALECLRGEPPQGRGAFQALGLLKYGTCALAFAACWRLAPLLAPLAFYAVEAQMVFLFPLVLDGHPAPWRESLRLTRRAGGTFKVMRTVIRLAFTMLLGGFADGRFVRAWCLGCLAVVLWYEEVRRA